MPDQGFAADLEFLRRHAGLSLRDLARSTGIARSTLSDALAGRRAPRLETILAIVRACGADPAPWRRRWAEMSREQKEPDADSEAEPGPAAAPVPAQLPRDVAGFASREGELSRLDGAGVAVVHGRPGSGKTALVVHWAHSAARRYPDGQVFLNLRGHHATLNPLTPVEALGRLLGSLGVSWTPATQDPDEGAALWRSSLAGRRLLIVLDDAVDAEQIRPLLPGAPGSTLIVTSRHHLTDLIVHDGADSILVDVLPAESSAALLGLVVGSARVAAEPDAAATVARACGHLPLALRLAGAVLAGAADLGFAEMARELTTGDRLSALEGLSRPSPVERAFELSYRALPPDAALLFRRLGLQFGQSIGVQAAALLADLSVETTGMLLRTLAEAHLIEPGRSGRFRTHDLLHAYAARLVESSDTEAERDAARRRLLDWYLDRAVAVCEVLDRGRERAWVEDDVRSAWEPSDEAATEWLDAEHHNVTAVIEYDAHHGTGRYAWALVDLMTGVLFRRKEVAGLIAATDAGLTAARRHGDRRAEGVMLLRRGWLRWRGGQRDGATEDFARARQSFHDSGARRAEASALRGLSNSHAYAGRLAEARGCALAALAIYREDGDVSGQAATLSNLAFVTDRAADFTASAEYLEASLALHRAAGSRGSIAMALANLAHVQLVRGALARALECNEEAIALAREIGDGVAETIALANSTLALDQAGATLDAHRHALTAVERAQQTGFQFGEAAAMDVLATMSRRLGQPEGRLQRSRALGIAQEVNDLAMQAEILVGAARDAYRAATQALDPPADTRAIWAARDAAHVALEAASLAGSPHIEAEAIAALAACDLALGKVADAIVGARRAVEMHVASGARLTEITARCILAHALRQKEDSQAAVAEWRTAHNIADELGLPSEAPVRRLLDAPADSPFLPLT